MKYLVVFVAVGVAFAAPPKNERENVHYDQRQNGTENYRVNVDGLLLAIAPAEAVLNAVSSSDLSDLLGLLDYEEPVSLVNLSSKPPSLAASAAAVAAAAAAPVSSTEVPSTENEYQVYAPKQIGADKPLKRASLRRRLVNLIRPLLKKNRQE